MTVTHTRKAFGTQLREALDDMQSRSRIKSWQLLNRPEGPIRYQLIFPDPHSSFCDSPGNVADYLNKLGYDIRIGNA